VKSIAIKMGITAIKMGITAIKMGITAISNIKYLLSKNKI